MSIYILDTETTGKHEPECIELAYVKVTFNPLYFHFEDVFHKYYVPSKPIEYGAMATHHILMEDLVKNSDCMPRTCVEHLPNDMEYLIGHNVDYDWRVLKEPEVKRIDTLAMARNLLPDLDSHTQIALMYYFSECPVCIRDKLKEAHSAVADIGFCASIFYDLLIEGEEQGYDLSTIEKVWEFSELSRIPKTMPFGKHQGMEIPKLPYDYKMWILRQDSMDEYIKKAVELSLKSV